MSSVLAPTGQVLDYEDVDKYDVVLMEDAPILTNVLKGLCTFRRHHGQVWPRHVVVHKAGRMTLSAGKIQVKTANWTLRDALFFSIYRPVKVEVDRRQPRPLYSGRRAAPEVIKPIYRYRRGK